jgi:hypothetical protein
MSHRNKNINWIAGLFIAFIMLSACAPKRVTLMRVTPLTSTSMVIYAAMTRYYYGSNGVVNIYVDRNGFPDGSPLASGQEKIELTATLWLLIVDHPETYTSIQVRSGQTTSFEDYQIKILRIGQDDQENYFVELELSEIG